MCQHMTQQRKSHLPKESIHVHNSYSDSSSKMCVLAGCSLHDAVLFIFQGQIPHCPIPGKIPTTPPAGTRPTVMLLFAFPPSSLCAELRVVLQKARFSRTCSSQRNQRCLNPPRCFGYIALAPPGGLPHFRRWLPRKTAWKALPYYNPLKSRSWVISPNISAVATLVPFDPTSN